MAVIALTLWDIGVLNFGRSWGVWEIGPRIEDGFGAKVSDSWEFQQVPPGRWCDNSFDKDDWFINVLKDINLCEKQKFEHQLIKK